MRAYSIRNGSVSATVAWVTTTPDSNAAEAPAQRGRPRDPERDLALRQAALEVLAEEGYDRLTMELVAQRAGAGKATIYRRWSSKVELVIDAVELVKPQLQSVDTGSLETDLQALVDAACTRKSEFAHAVMCGVASALGRDPDLLAAFNERFTQPRVDRIRGVLENARERGELGDHVDIDFAATIVPSLIQQRALLTGCSIERSFVQHAYDQVLRPMLGLPVPHPQETDQ